MKRVVVTGMAGISPIGNDWETIYKNLKDKKNGIVYVSDWDKFDELLTRLGGVAAEFTLPDHYNRKSTRTMGRVSLMATYVTELALIQAGLLNSPDLTNGKTGVAYGSSTGSTDAIWHFARMKAEGHMRGITATSYIKMMPHTTAANISLFFKTTGRVIPTSSACTSGSQGIGYAYEAIKSGKQTIMIAGGAEELCVTEAAVFDVMYAASKMNSQPHLAPKPFDRDRDGLVIGEGAGTLILEEYEYAKARGAKIYAELVGFGTNANGTHVTQPSPEVMKICIEDAINDAGVSKEQIGYINAHATATEVGDIAESIATNLAFSDRTPISSIKSYMGHTLGASGSLEAWLSIEMMNNDWFAPTINLNNVDSRCAPLDYIVGDGRKISTEYVLSNNFAFGGINTSLIFKRYN